LARADDKRPQRGQSRCRRANPVPHRGSARACNQVRRRPCAGARSV